MSVEAVQHTSLRTKLRNFSKGRKSAHFHQASPRTSTESSPYAPDDDHDTFSIGSTEETIGSPGRSGRVQSIGDTPLLTPEPNRTRGRSASEKTRSHNFESHQDLPEAMPFATSRRPSAGGVLASPILSRPTDKSIIPSIITTPAKSSPIAVSESRGTAGSVSSFMPSHAETETSPSNVSHSSFLATVITAAQSLGSTVLGNVAAAGNRPTAHKESNLSKLVLQNNLTNPANRRPSILSGDDAIGVKSVIHPLGEGELSLSDMGIYAENGNDIASKSSTITKETEAASRPAHLPVEQQLHVQQPTRSTSVAASFTGGRRRMSSVSTQGFVGLDVSGQQKITGFAVASNKRNREFHSIFRSVIEEDYLLDDYGCALQKEILVQGRLYVSESHICFNSNIFGWVTNLVIAFADIISIEKRSTAGIFPNALQISTLHAKNVFASFISRDTTYDLVVSIWRLTHPSIQTSATGVSVAQTADEFTSDNDATSSSARSSQDDSADESLTDREAMATVSVKNADGKSDHANNDESKSTSDVAAAEGDFPGPKEHTRTEAPSLTDGSAFDKELCDDEIKAPLGMVYNLLYGDDNSFVLDFLENNQKVHDIHLDPFSKKDGKRTRYSHYIKPLGGSIGPKQTKCNIEEIIEHCVFENYIQVLINTTTPDVPSGDAFVVKTRIFLMWGLGNTTRMICNCTIEWSKSSWIKGAIEKGANGGQIEYTNALVEALKARVAIGGKRKKTKTKRVSTKLSTNVSAGPRQGVSATSDLSLLGRTSSALESINLNALIFVLLFAMILCLMKMQRSVRDLAVALNSPGGSFDSHHTQYPRWQQEEIDLWQWLEQRTGRPVPRELNPNWSNDLPLHQVSKDKLGSRRHPGQQIEEAIRTMEDKLSVLKKAAAHNSA